MEQPESIITVRSRRQALDWCLVLASQDIEAVIGAPTEERGWHLTIPAPDYARALQTLRLYHLENRKHAWVRQVPGTDLVFDLSCVGWLLALLLLYWLDHAQGGHLKTVGMMDNQAVRSGEWWRLWTAIMLHADAGHLAANLTTGLLLLGLAMGTLGSGLGLLGACLAGVLGNVAGLFFYADPHRGLGASGMVLGALGLLTAQSLKFWRAGGNSRPLILRSAFGGIMLLVLLGLNPNPRSDVVAHVAGFLGGLGLGAVLVRLPVGFSRHRWTNRLAVLICAGLAVLTWGLALR